MPEETTTPTASTPSAAEPTSTTATTAPATATTGAAKTSEKTYSQGEVERMMQDRVKSLSGYKQAYEKMVERGIIERGATPQAVMDALEKAAIEEAENNADPATVARLTAEKTSRSAMLDARIEMRAEDLAKNPMFSDVMMHLDDIKPLARLLGGDVKKAYLAFKGDEAITRLEAAAEARAIANLAGKSGKQVETGDSGGVGVSLGLSATEVAYWQQYASDTMTLEEYAALKKIDDYDGYRRLKKKG